MIHMIHVNICFMFLSCCHAIMIHACNIIIIICIIFSVGRKTTGLLFLGVLSKLLGIPNNRQAPKGGLHGTAAAMQHAGDAANVAAAAAATAMRWTKS